MSRIPDHIIEEAKASDFAGLASACSDLKRSGQEHVGPCPICGGRDRFSINVKRRKWHCRGCSTGGHDAIGLHRHIHGTDFLGAIEALTCWRSDQEGDLSQRQVSPRRAPPPVQEEPDRDRLDAIDKARALYASSTPLGGHDCPVRGYFEARGLPDPVDHDPASALRVTDLDFWNDGVVIHRGPVMVAPFLNETRQLTGVHLTWIDLDQPKGKAVLKDSSGQPLPAKKMRGAAKGAAIPLNAGAPDDAPLLVAEGIESARALLALIRAGAKDAFFQKERSGVLAPDAAVRLIAAGSMGALGGRALRGIPHPVQDKSNGKWRRRLVAGPEPAMEDNGGIPLWTTTCVHFAGDGDSDAFVSGLAITRAFNRAERQGLQAFELWPRNAETGSTDLDFDDAHRIWCRLEGEVGA